MIIIILLGVGLVLGSFVNALVWRIHEQAAITDKPDGTPKKKLTAKDKQRLKELSVSTGRSMCLSCGHELAKKDLIPVVSWLWLRGKCRYCGAPIADTPLAELLVPLLLIVSYLWWPWALVSLVTWATFAVWGLCMVAFVALALYDLRWYLLPNRIVFPLTGLALTYRALLAAGGLGDSVLSVLLAGFWGVFLLAGLFYLLFIISNEQWIGGGDVKLAVALGLLSGGPLATLLLLFFASVSGTLASVPVIIKTRNIRGARIPFGPFLLLATLLTVLFSSSIIDWYTGLFL